MRKMEGSIRSLNVVGEGFSLAEPKRLRGATTATRFLTYLDGRARHSYSPVCTSSLLLLNSRFSPLAQL